MKTGGWVMIVVTWGIILFMFVFSFVKILKEHNSSRGGFHHEGEDAHPRLHGETRARE